MDPIQKILDIATQQGLLTPIGADPIKIRTSLYADDAMVFMQPILSDVEHQKILLDQFGMAIGLVTNMEKSEIFPIRCDDLNIQTLLDHLRVKQGTFSCKLTIP
jgi:hypothetical protein